MADKLRRRTHNIFGFAVSLWLSLEVLKISSIYTVIALSLYLTIAINWVIDSIAGHKGFRRTPYTHSILGAVVISTAVFLPILLLAYMYNTLLHIDTIVSIYVLSLSIGLSHLLLDMLTADGIYPLWPVSRSKISLIRARYDNLILNTITIIISVIVIAISILNRIRI